MAKDRRQSLPLALGSFLFLVACVSLLGCGGVPSSLPAPPSQNPGGLKQSLNHIVFMFQENRSFDQYFGQLNSYRASQGAPQDVEVNPPNFSNPNFDNTGTVSVFHLKSVCINNSSPSWNESHVQRNRFDASSLTNAPMDGFVYTAAKFAQDNLLPDTEGFRAMGYYDASQLNYYYFMATQFATSDHWFSPAPTRTQPNRMYSLAATSVGHAYPPDGSGISANTIFHLLEAKGISWKVYLTDATNFLKDLGWFNFVAAHPDKFVSKDQFFADAQNGTLPAVAMIEPGSQTFLDEHPDRNPQIGAAYVSSLINALMASPQWKESVFILTFDEAGGQFEHVPPIGTVNPDGIPPQDLRAGDIQGDFTITGFRVPLIVVSPFARKNYVSHTPTDYTAILKLIETRFDLPNLTKRDAAQMDMTEFFDFVNPPWMTPPSPPAQKTDSLCDFVNFR